MGSQLGSIAFGTGNAGAYCSQFLSSIGRRPQRLAVRCHRPEGKRNKLWSDDAGTAITPERFEAPAACPDWIHRIRYHIEHGLPDGEGGSTIAARLRVDRHKFLPP